MDQNKDLANKAVAPQDAGVSDKASTGRSGQAASSKAKNLEKEAVADAKKLAEGAIEDAEAALSEAKDVLADAERGDLGQAEEDGKGLVEDVLDDGEELASELADGLENLVEGALELLDEGIEKVKDFLHIGSEDDAEHDAALRAQYDGTHEVAASGGDSADNPQS